MSNEPRPAHELRAPTIEEGLNEVREEQQETERRVIIQALNERFPQGLQKPSIMMLLPRCLDQVQALLATWDAGISEFIGLCVVKNPLLLNMACPIKQEAQSCLPYMFSEEHGWHVVTVAHILRRAA